MTRLSLGTLAGTRARVPAYERAAVTPGIVHLGLGNFHRAHQAVFVDDCLCADPSWGIRGVSLRRPDMGRALTPQDGLYTLAVKDGDGTRARVVGSVLDVLVAPGARDAVLAALADPAIRIVSLTVTEKGYCHDPASGDLDPGNPGIRSDLADPSAPSTAPGLLAEALRMRRAAGVAPFTVLSCDNLPSNGRTLARIVAQYAELRDADLARFIAGDVAFPSTMVDRIVPATTEADRAVVAALIGREDAWPVLTEPFSQWVIEDRFPTGRPDFAAAGAELVADVEPYERMKLRMLNGAHSTLAYFGQLLGHETVADAMGDPGLARLVARVMRQAAATLYLPGGDLARYAEALEARFRNPALKHRTGQIAMDGSQKIPQRFLDTIRHARAAGLAWDAPALGVAAWIACLRRGPVEDPMAERFAALAGAHPDPVAFARAVLDQRDVFGDLAEAEWFGGAVTDAVATIAGAGAGRVLAA
ncbi:mannitol dehydrogenase family protein [Roseibacterium sp. SDUM158016]|uniref:mannitol dehydrogenase family protein n=1 Tax=Roseicyclus sediminis TaxID=2980997 RepID=UPI0021D1E793|nr:mannitol dehydrogenase family protein [Roseibacterium sp. SDUM158016]MCU4651422.1 mannitol dehydrogenase family protein [Roseibacterium sp. SDUM158016]